MREELEKAGYREDEDGNWHYRNGAIAAYSAIFPSIDSAYRHYEEGKHFDALEENAAEMKAFIKEILSTTEKALFKAKGANPELINHQIVGVGMHFDDKDIERMKRLLESGE